MNKIIGISLIILAIAIAVIPMFTDCESQGKSIVTSTGKEIAMKCHWTGRAELGVAIPLAAVGLFTAINRRKYVLMSMGGLSVVLGAIAIALPGGLIGVCQTPTMLCHTLMSPALIVLGGIVIATGAGTMLFSRKVDI